MKPASHEGTDTVRLRLHEVPRAVTLMGTGSRKVGARHWGRGWEAVFRGDRLQFGKLRKFRMDGSDGYATMGMHLVMLNPLKCSGW